MLSQVFAKIRERRRQNTSERVSSYLELVRALARGAEIDTDRAADVIEAAGKTEEQLQADVETQNRRFEWAAGIAAREAAKAAAVTLKQKHEAIKAKNHPEIARLNAEITDAFSAWNTKEHEILRYSQYEDYLRQHCLDPVLSEREQELKEMYRDAAAIIRKEEDAIAETKVSYHEMIIETERAKKDPDQQLIADNQEAIDHFMPQVSRRREVIAVESKRRAEIEAELADIARRKLIP